MAKHILILSMSTYSDQAQYLTVHHENKIVVENSLQTNEAAVSYLSENLADNGGVIDAVYMLATYDVLHKKILKEQASYEGKAFRDWHVKARGKTHLDFFCERMDKRVHQFIPIELGEEDLVQAYKTLGELYEYIREELKDEEVILHFDTTGGRRDTTMLMLILLNLLVYEGAEIGNLIYSLYENSTKKVYIKDASPLLSMFKLVGGTEEFATYGSVELLDKFFDDKENLQKEIKDVLVAMKRVSDELKVCGHYEKMISNLQSLQMAIETCLASSSTMKGRDIFFTKLFPIIRKEYDIILPKRNLNNPHGIDNATEDSTSISQIDIIKWCLHKQLLQQGVTYYTEWIPIYLFKTGLLKTTDVLLDDKGNPINSESNDNSIKRKTIKTLAEERGGARSRWEVYLLKDYELHQEVYGEAQALAEAEGVLDSLQINTDETFNVEDEAPSERLITYLGKSVDNLIYFYEHYKDKENPLYKFIESLLAINTLEEKELYQLLISQDENDNNLGLFLSAHRPNGQEKLGAYFARIWSDLVPQNHGKYGNSIFLPVVSEIFRKMMIPNNKGKFNRLRKLKRIIDIPLEKEEFQKMVFKYGKEDVIVLNWLLHHGALELAPNFAKKDFLTFIYNYYIHVLLLRNRFNHASTHIKDEKDINTEAMKQWLLDNVYFLEKSIKSS